MERSNGKPVDQRFMVPKWSGVTVSQVDQRSMTVPKWSGVNVSGVKVYRTEQSVFRDQCSIEILDMDSSKKEPSVYIVLKATRDV